MTRTLAVLAAASALLLTGCAATDPEQAARDACADVIEDPHAYADSLDGDLQGETLGSVNAVDVDVVRHSGGTGYELTGTASLEGDTTGTFTAEWACFAQTVDGKTYAAITRWGRV